MISVRILTAALLICVASAFAQEQFSSTVRPNRTPEPEKSLQATTSEPWKIALNQPADSRAGTNSLQQEQIDAYKIDRSRIDPNGRSLAWSSLIDPMEMSDAEQADDTVCFKIRSYVVARDNKHSDSVHPVGYSTCQPASRYRLRTTQIRTDSSNR